MTTTRKFFNTYTKESWGEIKRIVDNFYAIFPKNQALNRIQNPNKSKSSTFHTHQEQNSFIPYEEDSRVNYTDRLLRPSCDNLLEPGAKFRRVPDDDKAVESFVELGGREFQGAWGGVGRRAWASGGKGGREKTDAH